MGQLLILLVVALVAAALVFGVVTLLTGGDQGLEPVEPDGRVVPLPAARPLTEVDLNGVRFDVAMRGYRMAQVDQALRRAAYDIGYKEELINVLEAEVAALREGRTEEAESLRRAREKAARPVAGSDTAEMPVVSPADAPAVLAEEPVEVVLAEEPVEVVPAEEPEDEVAETAEVTAEVEEPDESDDDDSAGADEPREVRVSSGSGTADVAQ